MFKYNLPYSGEEIVMPVVTFRDVFWFARLIYENNIKGFSDFFDELFNSKKLNVIDKLFLALKARELFINDNISFNIKGETYSFMTSMLVDSLTDIEKKECKLVEGDFTITFEPPSSLYCTLNYGDLLSSTIHTITVDDITVNFRELNSEQQHIILTSLPPKILTGIKEYIAVESAPITIYNGIVGKIDPIQLNVFSNDILNFIKLIFSDYDLNTCRETIFYLSKHVSAETLMTSTCNDINFYIDEAAKVNKSNSGGNSMSIA